MDIETNDGRHSSMPTSRSHRIAAISIALLLLVLAAVLYLSGWLHRSKYEPTTSSQQERVAGCSAELNKLLGVQERTVQNEVDISNKCIAQIANEDVLEEGAIRSNAFTLQQGETTALMWLVMCITASGVALAAWQLLLSYRLSLLGKAALGNLDRDTTIAHSKLTITSSTVGVVILAISLAFFYVFTQEIYQIREIQTPLIKVPKPIPNDAALVGVD